MKTINLNDDFHTALMVVKSDTGAAVRFQVHVAIREYFERYHPHLVPVLKGDEPDEALEPAPFENRSVNHDTSG
jgi:hypothetical protein